MALELAEERPSPPSPGPAGPRPGYPWRVFPALAALGEIAVVLAVPRPLSPAVLVAASVAAVGAAALGLGLGRGSGLGAPLLEGALRGEAPPGWLARLAGGLAAGIGVGAAIAGALRLLVMPVLPALHARFAAEVATPLWKRWIIAFDAAVLEETLFRLFLVTAVVWAIRLLTAAPDGPPSPAAGWTANSVAALAFALVHVPRWAALAPGSPSVIAVVLATNVAAGLVFGRLFLRRGIETAMIAHFGADAVVHVLGPALLAS